MKEKLNAAINASIKAGHEILRVYETSFNVSFKDDESPITIADKNANQIITSLLSEFNVPIISEESKQIEFETRKLWQQCWIVDPLDGTREFVKRNGEFTVNIAFVENGHPIMGVIYAPTLKQLYFAEVKSNKAFKYTITDYDVDANHIIKNAIEIKPFPIKEKAILISRSHLNQKTANFVNVLKDKDINFKTKSIGSSLKFCLIAEGKATIYPRFSKTMEWDTAAGHSICKAVGVEVIDFQTEKPLVYNKPNLKNPSFIVKNN